MEDYYQKYLKYKLKYLKLKTQKGGGKFCILTFNILHPYEKVTNITFKTLLKNVIKSADGKIKDDFLSLTNGGDDKYINNIADVFALADLKRFIKRKETIIDFIETHIKNGTIVCLQEVNEYILKELQSKFKNVISNKEKDLLISKTPRGNYNNSRDEYRVTIIPESYTILETSDLSLEFENDKTKSKKNAVYVKVQDETEQIYHVINVHFHYLYDKEIITSKVSEIQKLVKLKEGEKFVITGDTNKKLEDLEGFCTGLGLQSNEQDESINTFLIQEDIATAPDHILSNFKGELSIIEKINDKQIIYDETLIINLYDVLQENKGYFDYKAENFRAPIDESIVNKVFERFTVDKYFSDHKPILFIS